MPSHHPQLPLPISHHPLTALMGVAHTGERGVPIALFQLHPHSRCPSIPPDLRDPMPVAAVTNDPDGVRVRMRWLTPKSNEQAQAHRHVQRNTHTHILKHVKGKVVY